MVRQVEERASAVLYDHLHRLLQLVAAVAPFAAEDIARMADAMHADECVWGAREVTVHKHARLLHFSQIRCRQARNNLLR
jgi:LPS sulfotransferase NodH